MTFSILFWNIWLYNQLDGKAGATHLLSELKRVVDLYKPDFIGLNEVLQHRQSDAPFVLTFLKQECGYIYNHYTPLSAYNDSWLDGLALCSRVKINKVQEVSLCKNSYAERRGYPGYELKALAGSIILPGQLNLQIIVTHAMPLVPLRMEAIKDHYEGTRKLNNLLRSGTYSKNTILAADMNEPGFVPRSFRAKVDDVMHFRTGPRANRTWRHNAHQRTPIRANLDQLYWSKGSDFDLQTFKVLKSNISDHRPCLAVFQQK